MRWTSEPLDFLIDLRGITTRDEYYGELARHFRLPDDHRAVWRAFCAAIAYQTGPYRLRFRGWDVFSRRMPRHARRLRRFIEGYQAVHGEEKLAADYD